MKHLIMIFAVVLVLFLPAYAHAQDTVSIPRATFERAKQAADEVVVSRSLIAALESENALLRENKKLLEDKVSLLESINRIQNEKFIESSKVSAALLQERDIFQAKAEKLERSNKRWKKVAKIAGTVAIGLLVPKFF